MKQISYSSARQSFKSVMDEAQRYNEAILIYRQNGEDSVLMSKSHYEKLKNKRGKKC